MYKKENFPVIHLPTQIGTGYLLKTTEKVFPFKDGPFKFVSKTPVHKGDRLSGWYYTGIDGIGMMEYKGVVETVCEPLKPGIYRYFDDVWDNPTPLDVDID